MDRIKTWHLRFKTCLIVLTILISLGVWAQPKRIAVFAADGFNADEYWRPYTLWSIAGLQITNFSPNGGPIASGNSKAPAIRTSLPLSQFKPEQFDALFIPGGKSPEKLIKIDLAIKQVQVFSKTGKLTSAICHGPALLAKAGLLTGSPSAYLFSAEKLVNQSTPLGVYHDQSVVKSGNLLMARYPDDAEPFALQVLNQLVDSNNDFEYPTIKILGSYNLPFSRYALTALIKGTTNIKSQNPYLTKKSKEVLIRTISATEGKLSSQALNDTISKYKPTATQHLVLITETPIDSSVSKPLLNHTNLTICSDESLISTLVSLNKRFKVSGQTLFSFHDSYDQAPKAVGQKVHIGISNQFDYTELQTLTQSLISSGYSPQWYGIGTHNPVASSGLRINLRELINETTSANRHDLYIIGNDSSIARLNLQSSDVNYKSIIYLGRAVGFINGTKSKITVSAPEQMKWSLPQHLHYSDKPFIIGKSIHTIASIDHIGAFLNALQKLNNQLEYRTLTYPVGQTGSITTVSTKYQDGISRIKLRNIELKNPASVMHPVLFKYDRSGHLLASVNNRIIGVEQSADSLKLTMTYQWLAESWHPSIEPDHVQQDPLSRDIDLKKLSPQTRNAYLYLKHLDSTRIAEHIDYERNYRKNESFIKRYQKQLKQVQELLKSEIEKIGFRRDAHYQIVPARASLPYLEHEYDNLNQVVDNKNLSHETDTLIWIFKINKLPNLSAGLSHYIILNKPVNWVRIMGTLELGGHINDITLVNFRYRGKGKIEQTFGKSATPFSTADIWPAPFNRKIWQPEHWYSGNKQSQAYQQERNAANMITMARGQGISYFDFQVKGDYALISSRKTMRGNFRGLTEVYPGDSMICQIDDEFFETGFGNHTTPIIYELINEKQVGTQPHVWRNLWYKTDQAIRKKVIGGLTKSVPAVGFNWDFYSPNQSYTRASQNLNKHIKTLESSGVQMVLNHNAGWLNGQGAKHGLDGQDTSTYVGTGTCNIYDYKPLPTLTNSWKQQQTNFKKSNIKYLIWITAMVERFGPMGKEVGPDLKNWAMFGPAQSNDVYEEQMGKFNIRNERFNSILTDRLSTLDKTIGIDGFWLDSWHNLWHSSYDWSTGIQRPMNQAWSDYFKPMQQDGKILMAEGHTQHGLSCSIETDEWASQPWYFGHTVKWLRNGEHKNYNTDSLNKLSFKLMACGGWLTFDILDYNTEGPYAHPDHIVPTFSRLAAIHKQFGPKMVRLSFLPDDMGVVWYGSDNKELLTFYFKHSSASNGKTIYQDGPVSIVVPVKK